MDQDNKPEQRKKLTSSNGLPDFNLIVHELWKGDLPLLQVFWLYYFTVLFVLKVMGDMLLFLASVFGIFELVWAGFMIKPVIFAADRYKGPANWKMAAKVGVLGIGLLVIADVVGKIF